MVGLIWFAIARLLAAHAAHGLSVGDWVDPVEWVALAFLLLVGYVAGERSFAGQLQPFAAMGLPRRPGIGREFGVGAAIGWTLLLLTILPSVLIGGIRITFWTAPHQWFLLLLDIVILLLAALTEELVFRGYPFQRLIDAIGPTLATLLMSAIFTVYHYSVDTPRPAIFVLFLLSCLLSIAYLRTRALWLPWAFHFAWNAAMGLLFGLPISGYTRFSPVVQSYALGPLGITGGDWGPEGSTIAVLVLLFGLWLMYRATREYAHLYAHPVIIPGGIPVDLDGIARRQHEAAMGTVVEPAEPKLVQIGSLPGANSMPAETQSDRLTDTRSETHPEARPDAQPEARSDVQPAPKTASVPLIPVEPETPEF